MKYPNILFMRHEKYKDIDDFINNNKEKLDCTISITDDYKNLYKLFDSNYHILITYGNNEEEYCSQVLEYCKGRFQNRWIHKRDISNIDIFNNTVNYCYINNAIDDRTLTRPVFSIFTTCYNSYNKIYRAL